jgi:hypothetical protein
VGDLAGAHQGIELLGGLREVGDRLAELDHLGALLLQPGGKLRRLPGIVGDLSDLEAALKGQRSYRAP